MALIELDDATPGVKHWVNTAHVIRVTRYPTASYTQVHFAGFKDNYISVRQTPDEIERLIDRAPLPPAKDID